MLRWRIYYTKGETFDNEMGSPWEAPGRGVICIVQIDQSPVMYNVGTSVLREHALYWYHRKWKMWFPSSDIGIIDQLTADKDDVVCAIKQGRWLHPVKYREIINKAMNDSDFPHKSGSQTSEYPLNV